MYEHFAIKYTTNQKRMARDEFISMHDMHDGLLPLDFLVWAAHVDGRVILVDSGADEQVCTWRGHDFIRCKSEGLRILDFHPQRVTDIRHAHAREPLRARPSIAQPRRPTTSWWATTPSYSTSNSRHPRLRRASLCGCDRRPNPAE